MKKATALSTSAEEYSDESREEGDNDEVEAEPSKKTGARGRAIRSCKQRT